MSRHHHLSSLGLFLAAAFMASARNNDALAQPVLAARSLDFKQPLLGHGGRKHFQAVQGAHDYQPKRHRNPNPMGKKPRFNKHSYF